LNAHVDAIREARENTLAAGTARIRVKLAPAWSRPGDPPRGLLSRAARALWRPLARVAGGWGHGVLDLDQRRYAIDYGSYAEIYEDGLHWGGRPGRPRRISEPEERPTPLWLIDLLAGTVEVAYAEPEPSAENEGEGASHHLRIIVDMERAADQIAGLYLPAAGSIPDLRAVPVDVWLDGGLLHRIDLAAESLRHTLELFDHGVKLDEFDWSRLPQIEADSGARAP
jgi:hypothetical protein